MGIEGSWLMAPGDLITDDWQVEWRGVVLGRGTQYGWVNLQGWLELPGSRIKYQARPGRHGSYAGQELMSERIITLDLVLNPGADRTGVAYAALISQLRTATAVDESPDPEPLTIRLSGQKFMVNARVERRSLPADDRYNAQASLVSIQWTAPDPRLYSAGNSLSLTCGLPNSSGGLIFPLVFPLVFGTGSTGNSMTVTNSGTITTWPTFTIAGPVTGPIITNLTTGQILAFDPTFVVGAGQTLVIDPDARTVTLQGVNRRSSLFTANWFGLPANVPTGIQLTSAGVYDPAAQLTTQWRNATI